MKRRFILIAMTTVIVGAAFLSGEYLGRHGLADPMRQMLAGCAVDKTVPDRVACLADLEVYDQMLHWCAYDFAITDRGECLAQMTAAYLKGSR